MTLIVDACPRCASRCSDDPQYAVLRFTLKWRWCELCESLVEYVRMPEPMRAARQARRAAGKPNVSSPAAPAPAAVSSGSSP